MLPVCTWAVAVAPNATAISATKNRKIIFMHPPDRFWVDVASSGRSLSHTGKKSCSRAWSTLPKASPLFHRLFARFSSLSTRGSESWIYTARYEVLLRRHPRDAARRHAIRRAGGAAAAGCRADDRATDRHPPSVEPGLVA